MECRNEVPRLITAIASRASSPNGIKLRAHSVEISFVNEQRSLLPGEQLNWAVQPELHHDLTDAQIEEKYLAGEVRIVTEQGRYPLNTVQSMVRSANYNLNPDFQRRHRWSREKQSRLVESFIMNVPVPPVFLYENEYSHYEVMDGLQRLTALAEFYEDRFALEGLEQWPELNGRSYSNLPEQIRRGIDRRYLSSVVLLYETAKEAREADRLKQLVFERINSGGEDLSDHETRNALYPGPMNRLCIRLARDEHLCRMWGIPEPTGAEDLGDPSWEAPADLAANPLFRKMEDAELVLRFFAHRQRAELWTSGTRLKDYHTRYLRGANTFDQPTLNALEEIFRRTIRLCFDILGPSGFFLWRERSGTFQLVERPTLIAYDPLMFAFSQLLDAEESVRLNAESIRAGMRTFQLDRYDLFDGRKTNAVDIRARDQATFEFIRQHLS